MAIGYQVLQYVYECPPYECAANRTLEAAHDADDEELSDLEVEDMDEDDEDESDMDIDIRALVGKGKAKSSGSPPAKKQRQA